MKKMHKTTAIVAALMLAITGCSETKLANGSGPGVDAKGMIAQLNFGDFGGGTTPQINLNPFSPNVLSGAGLVYEPLMNTNHASCAAEPSLSTGKTWSKDAKTLSFTLREGATWSDGKPFTSRDVAFTFNLMKKYPAIDASGLWKVLNAVTADGNKVNFTFNTPGVPYEQQVWEQKIVPEHIFASVGDPTKFIDKNGVGTGPYLLDSFNPRQLTMKRNSSYWGATNIKVEKIQYTKADSGGQVDQLKLARGEYDMNAMFIPQIEKAYVSKDPEHNKYWFPPGGTISLYMNLTKAPFNDVEFRKAIAPGLDRQAIIDKAQQGYVTQASQTGLKLPLQKDWLAPNIENNGLVTFDVAAANAALEKAGYRKDGSGTRTGKDGKPLSFTFKVQQGWTDWVQSASILQNSFKQMGIEVDVQSPEPDVVTSARDTGDFDLTFGVHGGECSMYRNYSFPLYSKFSAPIGTKATTNSIRWEDPATDKLIEALSTATTPEAQKASVTGLENIMMTQVPMIPLWYGGVWFEYRTTKAIGWPSEEDPYAYPGDTLIWLPKLRPAS